MSAVTVRVPATSANLGSAFDTAGIAFALYNTFRFELSQTLGFSGFDPAFCNETNLAYRAYRAVCEKIGTDSGVIITQIRCEVPVSRGLGSSATLTAAGAVAANAHDVVHVDDIVHQLEILVNDGHIVIHQQLLGQSNTHFSRAYNNDSHTDPRFPPGRTRSSVWADRHGRTARFPAYT